MVYVGMRHLAGRRCTRHTRKSLVMYYAYAHVRTREYVRDGGACSLRVYIPLPGPHLVQSGPLGAGVVTPRMRDERVARTQGQRECTCK